MTLLGNTIRALCHVAWVWLLVMPLVSCNHKDLMVANYDVSAVHVTFDYSKVTDLPASMRTYFYPVLESGEVGQPQIYDLRPEGGVVYLAPGEYNIVAYNVDAENILEENAEVYNDFFLTTDKYEVEVTEETNSPSHRVQYRKLFGSNVPFNDSEPTNYWLSDAPEWTISCRADHFQVLSFFNKASEEAQQLSMLAEEATVTVSFELSGFEGLQLATLVRGTLSGVPAGHQMATGAPIADSTMVSFLGYVDHEKNVITGTTRLWGYTPSGNHDTRQYLNIYIWAERGNYFLTEDITQQLNNGSQDGSPKLTVHLTSSINFFDGGEASGTSGFNPGVSDWKEEISSIQL